MMDKQMARKRQQLDPLGVVTVLKFDRALAANLRSPQYGWRNPQLVQNGFWELMIRVRRTAHWATSVFRMESDHSAFLGTSARRNLPNGPVFCFTRSGRTVTQLRDGRLVYVGGEHEDWYDVHFCIYNDVVVETPNGDINIYAYPLNVLSPTDFHSATLVGDKIYLIGSLGYSDQRVVGTTPVYILDTQDFSISSMTTSGEDPGSIYGHSAEYDRARNTIRIEGGSVMAQDGSQPNTERYDLNLGSGSWEPSASPQ